MFKQAYAPAAVPITCEFCYKIKLHPRTLRELVAAYEIAVKVQCLSKWGIDINNKYNQSIYAGYYYAKGLDAARGLFPIVRKAVDEHPKLGVDVPVVIKRGCSNFEAALGPSDKCTFQPEQREIEAYLKSRFRGRKAPDEALTSMLYGRWVPFAYRTGDDTYLDFTGGKPLHPKSLTYAP